MPHTQAKAVAKRAKAKMTRKPPPLVREFYVTRRQPTRGVQKESDFPFGDTKLLAGPSNPMDPYGPLWNPMDPYGPTILLVLLP